MSKTAYLCLFVFFCLLFPHGFRNLSAARREIISRRELLRINRYDRRRKKPCYEDRLRKARQQKRRDSLAKETKTPEANEPPQTAVRAPAKELPPQISGEPLFRMLPDDVVFCIRLNNFNSALNKFGNFLAGISPMPASISMIARAQLAKFFGSPDLKGIDTSGIFTLFAAPPGPLTPRQGTSS